MTEFKKDLQAEEIKSVTITQNEQVPTGSAVIKHTDDSSTTLYVSDVNELQDILEDADVVYTLTNMKTKVLVKCKKCGYEWEAIPGNLLRGHGCIECSPYTNKSKTNEYEEAMDEMRENGDY